MSVMNASASSARTAVVATENGPVSTEPKKVSRKKNKVFAAEDKPQNRMYLLDSQGVTVFTKSKNFKVTSIGRMDISEFAKAFQAPATVKLPFIPSGVFSYQENNGQFCVGIQLPPSMFDLNYPSKSGPNKFFRLSMPNIVFVANFIKTETNFSPSLCYIGCTKSPVNNITSHPVYALPINNIHREGRICWGRAKLPNNETIPINYAKSLLTTFMNSSFNSDLPPAPINDFVSLSDWETKSAADPQFGTKLTGLIHIGDISSWIPKF